MRLPTVFFACGRVLRPSRPLRDKFCDVVVGNEVLSLRTEYEVQVAFVYMTRWRTTTRAMGTLGSGHHQQRHAQHRAGPVQGPEHHMVPGRRAASVSFEEREIHRTMNMSSQKRPEPGGERRVDVQALQSAFPRIGLPGLHRQMRERLHAVPRVRVQQQDRVMRFVHGRETGKCQHGGRTAAGWARSQREKGSDNVDVCAHGQLQAGPVPPHSSRGRRRP